MAPITSNFLQAAFSVLSVIQHRLWYSRKHSHETYLPIHPPKTKKKGRKKGWGVAERLLCWVLERAGSNRLKSF